MYSRAHAPARLAVTALFATLTLAACTGSGEDETSTAAPVIAETDFRAPATEELAEGVLLGDQTSQGLAAVAASNGTVVAVGHDASANTTRPLFVVGADGTWARGRLDAPSVAATLGEEWPTTVAAGSDGFVAAGSGADQRPALWTSSDGAEWSRLEADAEVFRSTDWVQAIRHEGGMFYLLGGSSEPTDSASNRPILWTSDNGSVWERLDLSERGLSVSEGYVYIDDLVVLGGEVVVAGGIEDNSLAEQPNRMVVWRSDDGAKTFQPDDTPLDFGGGFRAYARDLMAEGSQLHLAASGDGADGSSWDGVVMSDRGSWTKAAPAALGSAVEEHPTTLLRAGRDWLVAGYTDGTREDGLVAVGRSLSALRISHGEGLTGSGAQAVRGGVVVGRDAFLVGSSDESGSTEAAVWRVRAGTVSAVRLPAEVTDGRPSTHVNALVRVDGGYVALGVASASPVAWRSDDFESWSPAGLSGRSVDVSAAWIADATAVPGGDVVAVGQLSRPLGSDLGVWRRKGRVWTRVTSSAFSTPGGTTYGSVWAAGVAAGHGAVVVAANSYVNGQGEVTPVVSTDGGATWERAIGAGRVSLSDQDRYFGRTPFADFRAPQNGSLSLDAVTATEQGFVLGGERVASGRGAEAVTWFSSDGRSWRRSATMPPVPGAHAVGVTSLVATGARVVATGYVQQDVADEEPGWVAWTSEDGGRTWTLGQVVAEREAGVDELLAVPGGFLALGSEGATADRDAAAWVSADGAAWRPWDVDIPRGSGPGRQALSLGVAEGDSLHAVALDVPPAGGGHHTVVLPLPQP